MKTKLLFVAVAIGCGFLTASCSSQVDSDAKSLAELECIVNKFNKSIDSLGSARVASMKELHDWITKRVPESNTKDISEITDKITEIKKVGADRLELDEELNQKRDIADDKFDLLRDQLEDKYKDRDEDRIRFKEKLLEFSKECI